MSQSFDAVEAKVLPNDDAVSCPSCALKFVPKRKNQRYCSSPCQKRASRNTARTSRKKENRVRSRGHYERASRLAEMVYSVRPSERLGMMQFILSKTPDDAGLRNILTDPKLLTEPPRGDSRKNIAQAASAYTNKFFRVSIQTYLEKGFREKFTEDRPVRRQASSVGPVPNLKKLTARNVRCWHKPLTVPLSCPYFEQFAADMHRVSSEVVQAQSKVRTYIRDDASTSAAICTP